MSVHARRRACRLVCALGLMIGLVPAAAIAGQISGVVRVDGRPAKAGLKIEVHYGSQVYSGTTSEYGTYLVSIPHSGRCQLTIRLQGDPTVTVVSYPEPTTYDIDVAKVDGAYRIVRAEP